MAIGAISDQAEVQDYFIACTSQEIGFDKEGLWKHGSLE
jgi:hypothetical protein